MVLQEEDDGSEESSLPFTMKCIDFVRRTHTTLDVLQEHTQLVIIGTLVVTRNYQGHGLVFIQFTILHHLPL